MTGQIPEHTDALGQTYRSEIAAERYMHQFLHSTFNYIILLDEGTHTGQS